MADPTKKKTSFGFKRVQKKKKKLSAIKGFVQGTKDTHNGQEFIGALNSSGTSKPAAEKKPVVIPLCLNPWDTAAKNQAPKKPRGKQKKKVAETASTQADREAAEALLNEATGGDDVEDSGPKRVIAPSTTQNLKKDSGKKTSQLLEIVMNTRKMVGVDADGRVLNENERFKRDLEMRPENQDVEGEQFSEMPIEDFGAALMRGMGWKGKGSSIGLREQGPTLPVQASVRPGRLGLGAVAKPWEKKEKHFIKPGEKRHKAGRIQEGCHVGVIKGPYEGDIGPVIDIIGSSAVVQLEIFGDKTQPKSFLVVIDSSGTYRKFMEKHPPPSRDQAARAGKKSDKRSSAKSDDREERTRGSRSDDREERRDSSSSKRKRGPSKGDGDDRGRRREASSRGEARKEGNSDSRRRVKATATVTEQSGRKRSASNREAQRARRGDDDADAKRSRSRSPAKRRDAKAKAKAKAPSSRAKHKRRPLWLRPHIRVRLVGKAHYREKGTVINVLDPVTGACLVRLDSGQLVKKGTEQRDLETVLPRAVGGEVIVLVGPSKGERGKLIGLDKRKEAAVVQLHHNLNVLQLKMDDAAEFVGQDEWS